MRRVKLGRKAADNAVMQDADDAKKVISLHIVPDQRPPRWRRGDPHPPPIPVDHDAARRLCHAYDAELVFGHLANDTVAELLSVHITTVRAWRRGARPIPESVHRVLKLLQGDLSAFHQAWKGWRIDRGELHAPDGHRYRSGEIMAITYQHALIRSLEDQIATLTAQLLRSVQADWVADRWTAPREQPTDSGG